MTGDKRKVVGNGMSRLTLRCPVSLDPSPETMAEAGVWVRRSETGCGGQTSDSYGYSPSWDGNTQVCSQAEYLELDKTQVFTL